MAHRVLTAEGGVTLGWPEQQFGERTTLLVPEVGVLVQLPRRVAPYLGAATGFIWDFRGQDHGGTFAHLVFSVAGGLRVDVTHQLGLRAELRIRGIGATFGGTMADGTLGAMWRL